MTQPSITVPLGRGGALVDAVFVARPNQFLLETLVAGEPALAHLADRGRLLTTLVPEARLLLARQSGAGRKTAYQAVAAYAAHGLVSLDTVLPNRLIHAALLAGALPALAGMVEVRPEVTVGGSRFDFLLTDAAGRRCIVEVKSAGDVRDGVARFPDAPTLRGARHLRELADCAAGGDRAVALFVAQGSVRQIELDAAIDPQLAATLADVRGRGVEVLGYSCALSRSGLELGEAIPVIG